MGKGHSQLRPTFCNNALGNHRWLLVAALVLSSLVLVFLHMTGYHLTSGLKGWEAAFYIQKTAAGCLLLWAFYRWQTQFNSTVRQVLDLAGVLAFGLYFVHGPVVRQVVYAVRLLAPDEQSIASMIGMVVLVSVIGVLLSWAVVHIVRSVFGHRSRFLIGC